MILETVYTCSGNCTPRTAVYKHSEGGSGYLKTARKTGFTLSAGSSILLEAAAMQNKNTLQHELMIVFLTCQVGEGMEVRSMDTAAGRWLRHEALGYMRFV